MSSLWDDVKNFNSEEGLSNYDFFFGDGELGSADGVASLTPEGTKYLVYILVFAAVCFAYIIFRYARKKYRESVK